MTEQSFKPQTVEPTLIKTLKRPVNILITKMRNLKRRFFDGRKMVSFANHNLEKSTFQFIQLKPYAGDVYSLNGIIYHTHHHNKLASCIVTFRYLDKFDQDVHMDVKRSGLEHSTQHHYYKIFPCPEVLNKFCIFYSAPAGTKKILVTISTQDPETSGVYLITGTFIQRTRNRDPYLALLLNQAYEKFSRNFKSNLTEIKEFLGQFSHLSRHEFPRLVEIIFHQIKWKIPFAARYFGMEILEKSPDKNFAENIYYIFNRSGSISERYEVTKNLVEKNLLPNDFRLTKSKEEYELLKNGFDLNLDEKKLEYAPERTTLYLLHNSLPYNSGGYAARSHGLIKGITSNSQFLVRGLARSGYPTDRQSHISKKLPKIIPDGSKFDEIDYLVGRQDIIKEATPIHAYVNYFTDEIIAQAKKYKPFIIHAASFYHNGMAAIQAAKALGIKSAYEIRGLQEITKLSKEFYWEQTDQYKFYEKLEAQALQQADVSFTITKALRELMISRGVTKEIHVIPNAVDITKFKPEPKNAEILKALNIQSDEVVIGYAGSIVEYEGLDDLLVACRNLVAKNVKFKMLILGDGGHFNTLKKLTKNYNLQNHVIFTGRVPHNEVHKYISIIDIMPFPRKPYLVCEMVSPLKPFESLACKKAVIVSNCAALEEIIKHEETGLVFKKADTDDLTEKLLTLINNPELRNRLAENGYKWVCENRSWKSVSKIVTDIYEDLYQQFQFEQKNK